MHGNVHDRHSTYTHTTQYKRQSRTGMTLILRFMKVSLNKCRVPPRVWVLTACHNWCVAAHTVLRVPWILDLITYLVFSNLSSVNNIIAITGVTKIIYIIWHVHDWRDHMWITKKSGGLTVCTLPYAEWWHHSRANPR